MGRALIIGSSGQIGTDLIQQLADDWGCDNVLASDIREPAGLPAGVGFTHLNVMEPEALSRVVDEFQPREVYLMAAMLSATGEKMPLKAWDLNMNSLLYLLELLRQEKFEKLFFPSSIAVFGASTPKDPAPQHTIIEPQTVYGISKFSGELWCDYYRNKYGVDVRSLRYPGLISYKTEPGGGTTDYAVQIFYDALQSGKHTCFLGPDTRLPMMYMPDAIRGTRMLMSVPSGQLNCPTAYNFAALSFTPVEIFEAIRSHVPGFEITYEPDFRQQIANGWPAVIDDADARNDWNWKPEYDLHAMCRDMLDNLDKKLSTGS